MTLKYISIFRKETRVLKYGPFGRLSYVFNIDYVLEIRVIRKACSAILKPQIDRSWVFR